MTSQVKDNVFALVKSLSKSEKRQFKLYVGRLGGNADAKFLSLFNLLDKIKKYDEKVILKSGIVKKAQLSNLKAHLYKQILISLRLNPVHQNVRVQLREQLDFATILYHKGLYKQSLKILEKAKKLALENEEKNMAYEIVELEKVIESQFITRSISGRADELTEQAKTLSIQNTITSKLSNLSLQLYGLLLKTGYVKNDTEFKSVTDYFNARMPDVQESKLDFREKLWFYKSHLWYAFLVQDFVSCYKYARKWTQLFKDNPNMIFLNPVFFIKGYNYLLEALFYLQYYSKFKETLSEFEAILADSKALPNEDNIKVLGFQYLYFNKLNLHFLEGTFKEGLSLVDEVLKRIKKHGKSLDEHHIMVFYYKIACMYFGAGDNKKCIFYLDKIIENKSLEMREDLMCFARILSLVAHYEAGLDYHLELQVKRTYKFLLKMNELHEVQKAMIKFLRNIGHVYPHQFKAEFKKLHQTLKKYEADPYERRAFLYLDILSWLESKIENRPIDVIIQEKFKALKR